MRVVLDTNILLSAFLWQGNPARLFDQLHAMKATLLSSEPLLEELSDVLSRPKFIKRFVEANLTPEQVLTDYRQEVELVYPAPIPSGTLRDPDDEAILGCAVGGQADYIVSGDDDLLSVKSYQGIPILTATQCLELLGE